MEATATSNTGLAKIDANRYLALNLTDEMREAQEAAESTGETFGPSDLIRVKTPAAGATTWVIPGPAGDEETKEIVGILVCYQPTGILWPSDDATPGTKPVLRTFNPTAPDAVAEQVGPIPDDMLDTLMKFRISEGPPATFRWADLPYNQWGSGKRQVGKRVKEKRMMFLLREGDMFPLQIDAPPGSLKNVTKWFKQLTPTAKVPYYRCVVSLTLAKDKSTEGKEFSKIVPKLVGIVPSDVGALINEKYTQVLRKLVVEIEETADTDE